MAFMNGRWLQVWELGSGAAAEDTLEKACQTALDFGFQGILVKALDGMNWHSSWSDNDDAVSGPNMVSWQKTYANKVGLEYGVWCNPHWFPDREDLRKEAGIYAVAGASAGLLVLDAEPYPSFWGANRPEGDAQFFLEQIRRYAPDLPIIFQPDGRHARLEELRHDEWYPNTNGYAPQDYWTDFTQDPVDAVRYGGTNYPLSEFCPTFPGDGNPSDYERAWNFARDEFGATGLIVWRLGTANSDVLNAVKNLKMPDQIKSDQEKLSEKDEEIKVLKERVDTLTSSINNILTEVTTLRDNIVNIL